MLSNIGMEIINTSLPFAGVMSSLIGGRLENQDTCGFAETSHGLLLVVCDGMGGGPAGKTASVIATRSILDFVKNGNMYPQKKDLDILERKGSSADLNDTEILNLEEGLEGITKLDDVKLLEMAVKTANTQMCVQIRQNPSLAGMGTTVAVLLINDRQATIAHVGDSRIYQMRGKRMIFRTADHSRVGEMVRAGSLSEEQARLSAYSNVITRALGIGEDVEVDVHVRPYEKGDRFILCTDGIWGAKPQKEIIRLFSGNPKSLEGTMDILNLNVEKEGKEKGGRHDNYTAIILETKTDSTLKEIMSRKLKWILRGLGILCGLSIALNIVFLCVIHSKWKTVEEIDKETLHDFKAIQEENENSKSEKSDASSEETHKKENKEQVSEKDNSFFYNTIIENEGIEMEETSEAKDYLEDVSDTYKVKKNDTLDKLATKWGVGIEKIKVLNNLRGDKIQEGQILKIPPQNH